MMPQTLDPFAAAGDVVVRRAEVDTSAPFESVREAVDRFGGSAMWKLQLKQLFVHEKHEHIEELEHMTMGEQTSKLEMDLMLKDRETLAVLKELEVAKRVVDELKMKLHKESSESIEIPGTGSDSLMLHPSLDTEDRQLQNSEDNMGMMGSSRLAKQSPELIFLELKQAKFNLSRTTSDLASVRASIELLNSKIHEEKILLQKTHEQLNFSTMKASSFEEELNRTKMDLQRIEDVRYKSGISSGALIQNGQLTQKEKIEKIKEAAAFEVSKLTAEIKETNCNIKAAEIRYLAAKNMEEAAKVAEAAALAKIKALTNSKDSAVCEDSSKIVLSVEEYNSLTCKAQEADELSRKKVEAAMLQVVEANQSKLNLLLKVEEAAADVETGKKALAEALVREDAANREKLAIEAALRKRRSEHGQKKRSTNSSSKFKNSSVTHHRRDNRLDVNGLNLDNSGSKSPLAPPMSIGQILSRKLTSPEDYEATEAIGTERPNVSLGQILSRRHGSLSPQSNDDDANSKKLSKKVKKSFTGFSLQLNAKNKKSKKKKMKKRQSRSPGNCRPKLVSLLV